MNTKILHLVLFLILANLTCIAQWTQTNGPYGPIEITVICPGNNLTFTGTAWGTFIRNYGDSRWRVNSPYHVTCSTLMGDYLFAGTFYGGIKRFDLSDPEFPAADVNELFVQSIANSDTMLYVGHESQGFLASDDYGTTWVTQNEGLPVDSIWDPWGGVYIYFTNIRAIEVTPEYIFCGTDHGIFRRSLDSVTWIKTNSGLPSQQPGLIYFGNDTLFTVMNSVIYLSPDYGENWTELYTSASQVNCFLKKSGELYAGTADSGILYSADFGKTWFNLNTGLSDLTVTAMAFRDSTVLCGTDHEGLFLWQDTAWVQNNPGVICSYIWSEASPGQKLIGCDPYRVYRMETDGTWSDISPLVEYELFGSVMNLGDTLFLSVDHFTSGWPYHLPSILFSTNQGTNWQQLAGPVPFVGDNPYRLYGNNGLLYVYEGESCYFSGDLGQSWTDLSIPPQFCNSLYEIIVFNSIPFAADCGPKELLKYSEEGYWQLSCNGLPQNRPPLSFATCDSALFTDIEVEGLYVSFNEGAHWDYAGDNSITDRGITGYVTFAHNLLVSSEHGVFGTKDYGQHWFPLNEGLKNLNIASLVIIGDTIFAGTGGSGVWKRPLDDIHVGFEEYGEIPFSLHIFPNPSGESVTVETPEPENTSNLTLTDHLGREVMRIEFSGKRTLLNVQNLPEGLYILKLRNSTGTGFGKLIVQ